MVSDEKQYEFVSAQVRYLNDKIIEAFGLFLKLFSGIVGGSIWLSLQSNMTPERAHAYARISDILVLFLAVLACLMVAENLRGWHGYRWAQHRLGGLDEDGKPRIPAPRRFRASVTEAAMMASIIGAALFYCRFNPFTL